MIAFEKNNHRDDPELKTLYLSDTAYYEIIKNNLNNAVNYQSQAVECSKNCDNILLQANTVSTYGYYLNLADRKEKALKAMEIGLNLFSQLDDNIFYFDKYRAVINYADLIFSLGQSEKAINQVVSAKISLENLKLQNMEIYADCLYSLGLYHICLNDISAGDEIISSFRIFIDLYGKDSDFIQTRIAELQRYVENFNKDIIQYELLKQLLEE